MSATGISFGTHCFVLFSYTGTSVERAAWRELQPWTECTHRQVDWVNQLPLKSTVINNSTQRNSSAAAVVINTAAPHALCIIIIIITAAHVIKSHVGTGQHMRHQPGQYVFKGRVFGVPLPRGAHQRLFTQDRFTGGEGLGGFQHPAVRRMHVHGHTVDSHRGRKIERAQYIDCSRCNKRSRSTRTMHPLPPNLTDAARAHTPMHPGQPSSINIAWAHTRPMRIFQPMQQTQPGHTLNASTVAKPWLTHRL